jgi:hypothetical protein
MIGQDCLKWSRIDQDCSGYFSSSKGCLWLFMVDFFVVVVQDWLGWLEIERIVRGSSEFIRTFKE